MKSILLSISFVLLSATSFAGVGLVLETDEVTALEADMSEAGFHLYLAKDLYAETGMFPRCPCSSVEVTFRKVNYITNDAGMGKQITDVKYRVNSNAMSGVVTIEQVE